jgi:threonyl-tRNA synthetase
MVVGGEDFVLRPANCPHHTQVYASRGRSYRELPLRYSELGSMFRSELSGVLGGLSRVRQITLDDAHVFCTPDQVGDEVGRALQAIGWAYRVLGIDGARFRLSTRGTGGTYLGDDQLWEKAEAHLRKALRRNRIEFDDVSGEAAFYGPKIDVLLSDARGREETLSTVQLDFNQPERFGLEYDAEDGTRRRPVMIHRGVLGSMERMTAFLVEKYEGRLPPWLSPRQVAVLPVGADHVGAGQDLVDRLTQHRLRAEMLEHGSVGSRIRASRAHRDPYIVVIGDREVRDSTVSVSIPSWERNIRMNGAHFVHSVADGVWGRRTEPFDD